MKYRIWYNQQFNNYKVQRDESIKSWWSKKEKWVWLDVCNKWCNWYGKENPRIFSCRKDIEDCLIKKDWEVKVIVEIPKGEVK